MQKSIGRILRGVGGFYYVELSNKTIVECKARGSFRNKALTPFVGDIVEIEYNTDDNKGVIDSISPRKNLLIRPAVSNVDKLYIVCSTTLPQPNFFNIDKLTAIAINNDIEPIIVISKTDLDEETAEILSETYEKAGFKVFKTNINSNETAMQISSEFENNISVFTGNSGVGKSTFINQLIPSLELKTGEVSMKLSRGKHTTRHVELFSVQGGYIADTPGFSSLDFEGVGFIRKEDVINCFPDILGVEEQCRFPDCKHIGERDCAVKKAVENGLISQSRYESYCAVYKESEAIKDWEIPNKKGKR